MNTQIFDVDKEMAWYAGKKNYLVLTKEQEARKEYAVALRKIRLKKQAKIKNQ